MHNRWSPLSSIPISSSSISACAIFTLNAYSNFADIDLTLSLHPISPMSQSTFSQDIHSLQKIMSHHSSRGVWPFFAPIGTYTGSVSRNLNSSSTYTWLCIWSRLLQVGHGTYSYFTVALTSRRWPTAWATVLGRHFGTSSSKRREALFGIDFQLKRRSAVNHRLVALRRPRSGDRGCQWGETKVPLVLLRITLGAPIVDVYD